jgi:hypothetical protein
MEFLSASIIFLMGGHCATVFLLVSLALALVFQRYLWRVRLADKPPMPAAKGEKKEKEKQESTRRNGNDRGVSGKRRDGVKASQHFSAEGRIYIHNYYGDRFRSGRCPPGLAKKNNGCMPPGQAKKWMIGRPLPRDVVFYDLPPEVLVQLGPVPSRHRFVRVASDILMIAVGTGMVVDAVEDIDREIGRY